MVINRVGRSLARARARHLAYLLAGTALASVQFAGEAAAACTVTAAGVVTCAANTTTTNTTNLNGAAASSSDRIQEFNNGSNITAAIGNGVVIDGFGLQLLLSNAGGNNTITLTNDGLVTTGQPLGALQLNGNGGDIVYSGAGSVTNTGTGAAIVGRNTGPGAVRINVGATSTIQSAGGRGIDIETQGGPAEVIGTGTGRVIGGTIGVFLTSNGAPSTVSNLELVQGVTGNAIVAFSDGGNVTISNVQQIAGRNGFAIIAFSDGGSVSIDNNGSITSTHGGIQVSAGNPGPVSITGNGPITGGINHGILLSSPNGGVVIANNGDISGSQGINALAGIGNLSITGNGNITGTAATAGIGIAGTTGGNFIIADNASVTGAIHGIFVGGSGALDIQGNGNIIGTTGDGINVTKAGGTITIGNITSNGTISGANNGIFATTSGIAGIVIGTTSTITGGINGLNLSTTSGAILVNNNGTITGGTNSVVGSTTGAFNIQNLGILNGAVNVTGSNIATSVLGNFGGTWNAGTANSSFSGQMFNGGTLNAQNAVAGQTISFAGNYTGGGAVRVDLGDRLQMGGTATLTGGSLNVAVAPNSQLAHSTVVLSAAGGLGGTQFATTTIDNPNLQSPTIVYTPTEVLLTISGAQLGAGSNLNQNQQNVANVISGVFNSGGTLAAPFGGLFALTGAPLGNAMTQLSGESATGIQPATSMSMGMFLNTMLDPFVTGRNGANGIGGGGPFGYAPEAAPSRVQVAANEAFAADMPVKARPAPSFEQRWNIWGAGYGGRADIDGDPAVLGSNDVNAKAAGFAAGADYRVSRDTVLGLAVAVGQTRWDLSNGLGKGGSDVGQVGGYASTRWHSFYLASAVAFAWHRANTDRTVTVAGTDRLAADFDAQSIGGRVEGGYRFGGAYAGLTPYAAVQVQSLHTPAYSETSAGSTQFALSYASQTTTDTRSELGVWADTRFLFAGNQMTLRGRAAWVHDYNPESRISAVFQTLPGASFVVNGAAAPRNAALTSAVAELHLNGGWTLIGKFDGEFASGSRTLAGTGSARLAW
jgi:outer membrane autotransporter protein